MAFSSLDILKDQLGFGSRSNLFEVTLAFPIDSDKNAEGSWEGPDEDTIGESGTNVTILVKAAQIPAFTVGVIEVPYKAGRRIKLPGDRTFADWTITVINDEDHVARRAFAAWINMISRGNYDSQFKSTAKDYLKDLSVSQLKASGNTQRVYKLVNAFPTDVSAVDLSMDSTDTLSEFTVNFQYQYLIAGTQDEVDTEGHQTTVVDGDADAVTA